MSRLPIRLRLTAVFVVVMGAVLAIIGSFLYYRTKQNLDDSIAQSLRARYGALRSVAASAGDATRASIPADERFAQLLTPSGEVIVSRPEALAPLLTAAQERAAQSRPQFVEIPEHDRYLAGPATLHGRRVIAVVGASLAVREHALEGLGGALLIGGPLALLLASTIASATAAAALRPVDAMRRQASTIGRADPSALLPVPVVDDELRRLSETLNEMLARIARSAEHERAFVADASHELRTPLAALQAELELAERRPGPPAQMLAAIGRARQDVTRLINLTNGLLALAQADEDREGPREVVELADLLRLAAEESRPRAAELDRVIMVRPCGLTICADPIAIRRALTNLIDNALTHGAGDVSLGADLCVGERDIEIWVHDEGDVNAAFEHRAFDRFARGPDSAGRPGAGLGLSLVQATARRHGGSASLRNRPEGGARATLRLPARPA